MPMSSNVEIDTIKSISILVVDRSARFEQLASVITEACGLVWKQLQKAEVDVHGHNVVVYLNYLNDVFDLLVGVEVDDEIGKSIDWNEGLYASFTPQGEVAHAVHFGDYANLIDVHRDIATWSEDVGRPLAGPSWEVYGHWNSDMSKLRTDVYYLLA